MQPATLDPARLSVSMNTEDNERLRSMRHALELRYRRRFSVSDTMRHALKALECLEKNNVQLTKP